MVILRYVSFLLLFSSCIRLKDTVVSQEAFLGERSNSQDLYSRDGDGTLINPFTINTDNWGTGILDRLLLIEFEALEGYRAIELQIFRDGDESGALVILYYADKEEADIYYSPGLNPDESMYNNVLNRSVLSQAVFNHTFNEIQGKLQASLKLTDRFGRPIEMKIAEENPRMKYCRLLAPIGGRADEPEFMTIVFMKQFRFLSRGEEGITVKINGQEAKLSKLPLKVNGVKGLQTKYSMNPVCVSWNIGGEREAEFIRSDNKGLFRGDNFELQLVNNQGHVEIEQFTGLQDEQRVHFSFSPAVPDLICLREGSIVEGNFTMGVDQVEGIMAGNYSVNRAGDSIKFNLKPTKGYSPVPGKAWMKQMSWEALLYPGSQGLVINSKWEKQ